MKRRAGKATGMMTVRDTDGKQLAYRPMHAAELTEEERNRIDLARDRAERLRDGHNSLIEAASSRFVRFDQVARWVVATCRQGSEESIARELGELGIVTWCPKEHLRTRPRRKLKPVDIYRPYFGGYLFVRVIPTREAFAGLLAASRLQGIMGRDGVPYLMPEKLMNIIILAAKKDETDQKDKPKMPVRVGQRIDIHSGVFANFQATVRRLIPERWKLEAEVSLFGRMTPVELDIDSIEA
ncbi:transcription termination/antitermination protein NusG [Shinella sp.]|jgi:transcriptional antiterminator NusG|uniref:transcription termination/antitermination protein NusG n=1 Tax=Shinella sp. TaxID=1870904 RepID=UPI003F71BB1E